MKTHELRSNIHAFIPENTIIAQAGCNIGMIQTSEGIILIDTSVSVGQMRAVLNTAGIQPVDVSLVINTHLHADHINGNSLFKCPVICHARAKTRMAKKCHQNGQTLKTFEDEYRLDVGDMQLQLIHTGGHTPDSIIVWLPADKILFSGDLIFSGRAPFLASVTNFNALLKALQGLTTMGAEVIVPGHGPLCDLLEIFAQMDYLETTREVVRRNIAEGHSLNKTRNDPALPKMEGKNFQRNIEWIYKRLK
jgi:cyclase